MLAIVLANAWFEKFGGDSIAETRRNFDGYIQHIASRIGAGRDTGT
jgi:chorismate synthase